MVLETVIWGGTLTPRVRACIGMVRSTKQSFPTRDRDRRSGPRPGTIVASAPCGRTNRGAHHPTPARRGRRRRESTCARGLRRACAVYPRTVPSFASDRPHRPAHRAARARARGRRGGSRRRPDRGHLSHAATQRRTYPAVRDGAHPGTCGPRVVPARPGARGRPRARGGGGGPPHVHALRATRRARGASRRRQVMLQRCCIRMLYMTTHVYVL